MTDVDLQSRAGKNAGAKWTDDGAYAKALNTLGPLAIVSGEFLNVQLTEISELFRVELFNLSEAETVEVELVLIDSDGFELVLGTQTVDVAVSATEPGTASLTSFGAVALAGERIALRATGASIDAWASVSFTVPQLPVQHGVLPAVALPTVARTTVAPGEAGRTYATDQCAVYNIDTSGHIFSIYHSNGTDDFFFGDLNVPAGESLALPDVIVGEGQSVKLQLGEAVVTRAPYFRGVTIMFDASPAVAE